MYGSSLCAVYSNGNEIGHIISYGFRPCISLNPNVKVTAGDGETEATAYELGV